MLDPLGRCPGPNDPSSVQPAWAGFLDRRWLLGQREGARSWRAETMQGPVLEDLYEGQDGVAVLPATGQINPGEDGITPMTPHKPRKDGSVGSRTRSWSASGWVRLSAGGAVTAPA